MKPARLVSSPNCDETSAPRARGNLATFTHPVAPLFLAGRNSLGAARRLTEQRDAMGVLPGASGRFICPKSHHPRHPFSGFQSTDDPVCRNADTLEAVVMTETGRTSVKAAPLALLVDRVNHVGHVVLQIARCNTHSVPRRTADV